MMSLSNISLVLTLLSTLFMTFLAYLLFMRRKEKVFSHLVQLGLSLASKSLLFFLLGELSTPQRGLSMLGWIWPFWCLMKVLEDFSGKSYCKSYCKSYLRREFFLALGLGAFVSFSLAGYGFSFSFFSSFFALPFGGIGLWSTWKALCENQTKNSLKIISYSFIGLFFLSCLVFPLSKSGESFYQWQQLLDLVIIWGLLGSLTVTYLVILNDRYAEQLLEKISQRSELFVEQAKYSELGMMSAGIAHEINNPLTIIQARCTQLLRKHKDLSNQEDLMQALEQIHTAAQRIERTIRGLRELIYADDKEIKREIPLNEIFHNVLALTGQRIKNHGINLRLYGLENFRVFGKKIQLEQVFLNLISNSFDTIEFLPEKWIEVSSFQKDDKIQILFKDSGVGVSPEVASKMMDPFFTTKPYSKGSGLGLSLAKQIIEKHGGRLEYIPDAPHTTFLIELPCPIHKEWDRVLH